MNYKGILDVFAQSLLHEHSRFAIWAGFYTYFASTLMYATLTVGITSSITDSVKRAKGLPQWQI